MNFKSNKEVYDIYLDYREPVAFVSPKEFEELKKDYEYTCSKKPLDIRLEKSKKLRNKWENNYE